MNELRGEGDFIMSDYLAVGHKAAPETQLPTDVVSLHVSHRTNIEATVPPAKWHSRVSLCCFVNC